MGVDMRALLPYLVFPFVLGWVQPSSAITVSGTVRNTAAAPVAGVTLKLVLSKRSDTSDASGKFSMVLPNTVGLVQAPFSVGAKRRLSVTSGELESYLIDGSRVQSSRGAVIHFGRGLLGGNEMVPPFGKMSAAGGSKDTLVVEKKGYALFRLPIALGTNTILNINLEISDTVFTACNAAIDALGEKRTDAEFDAAVKQLEAYGNVCAEQAAAIAALPGIGKLPDVPIPELLDTARTYMGVPYVFGAGPYEETKVFDCSSFTKFIFGKFGVSLRRVSNDQSLEGIRINNRRMLRPGDMVFFHVNSRPVEVGHVGIYIGKGQMINANTGPEDGVQVSAIKWTNYMWAVKVAR